MKNKNTGASGNKTKKTETARPMKATPKKKAKAKTARKKQPQPQNRIEVTYTEYPNDSETLVYNPTLKTFVVEKWLGTESALAWLHKHKKHLSKDFDQIKKFINQTRHEAIDFELQKKELDKLLSQAGIKSVSMFYSGSGDSGDIDDLSFSGPGKAPLYLSEVVQDFLISLVYHKEPGWEINEGGQGEVRWEVGGLIQIQHESNSRHEDCVSYTKKPDDILDKILANMSVKNVCLRYSGSGDSGDVDDFIFGFGTGKSKGKITPDLSKKVENYLFELLEEKEGGWENNEGGQGEIIWTVGKSIEINHVNYLSDGTVTCYEIGGDS